MGREETLSSPIIRSQSFSESVPADWELHSYFSLVFPCPHLGQDGERRQTVGIFPSSGQLGFG